MDKKLTLKSRLKSFSYAFSGFKIFIKNEPNARIHFLICIGVITLGFILHINSMEWILILICIGLVISTEAINTAIEYIADFISPQRHEQIKKIKDISAFAVLFNTCIAVIIGLLIFIPKIINFV